MPLTWKIRGESAAKVATVAVIVALSWFAAVKEKDRSRRADRGSYAIGLRTDLSCLSFLESDRSDWCFNEPARWSERGVTIATLDAAHLCTRSGDMTPDLDSCAAHEEAVVQWMQETFAQAELQGSAAIMFILPDGAPDSHTELWLTLREELARFGMPVVDIRATRPRDRTDERLHK